jgi:hypothetical protein
MALPETPIPDDARVMLRVLLALGLALIVHGCAPPLRHETPPRASSAVADADTTWLGRLFVPLAGPHPGESGGLHLLDGREAFALRTALADVAERSIDAQYFIWSGDAVGTILMERLVRAANRGVRWNDSRVRREASRKASSPGLRPSSADVAASGDSTVCARWNRGCRARVSQSRTIASNCSVVMPAWVSGPAPSPGPG